jgi:peptidoglycan/xylan/chitin deacetylase (PgdA/CDA1 family)
MKVSILIIYIARALAVSLGTGWVVLCVVVPSMAMAPETPDDAVAVVPLPVAPVMLRTVTPTPTSTPVPTPVPTPTATPRVVGYSAYTMTPDESLGHIASLAGSDVRRIMRYNRMEQAPQAERSLIIPHLDGQTNTLPQMPLLVVQGHTERPYVALTLDAGAGSAPVPSILATLRERNIHLTFFLTGRWIEQNPELARQIVADGHEIANHSLSHADFTTLSKEQMIAELAATERLMLETTGTSTRPFFRPPYGAYNNDVLLTVIEQGYLPIYWTIDSLDSVGEPKTPAFLLERVTSTLSPEELRGAIILAHCGSDATAEALPAILDRFDALGLHVTTLSDMLGQ